MVNIPYWNSTCRWKTQICNLHILPPIYTATKLTQYDIPLTTSILILIKTSQLNLNKDRHSSIYIQILEAFKYEAREGGIFSCKRFNFSQFFQRSTDLCLNSLALTIMTVKKIEDRYNFDGHLRSKIQILWVLIKLKGKLSEICEL